MSPASHAERSEFNTPVERILVEQLVQDGRGVPPPPAAEAPEIPRAADCSASPNAAPAASGPLSAKMTISSTSSTFRTRVYVAGAVEDASFPDEQKQRAHVDHVVETLRQRAARLDAA
jgi:hypothetical protein